MFIQKINTSINYASTSKAGDTLRDLSHSPCVINPAECPATALTFERDSEIAVQDAKATFCFQVTSGCVRTVRLLGDGRRQIGQFLFAGDLFAHEAEGEYAFGAEAVTDVTLQRFRLSTLEDHARADRALALRLHRYSAAQLRLALQRVVLLGRNTAAERVSAFLLEMDLRLNVNAGPAVDLPMNRTDIADYLGLTIETVCRSLADLRKQGAIATGRGSIVIHNHRALSPEAAVSIH